MGGDQLRNLHTRTLKKGKRTGINRLSEYTDGMIDIINTVISQNVKADNMPLPSSPKDVTNDTKIDVNEKLEPNSLLAQDDIVLEGEKIKMMEAFQDSMFANVNAASNNLSLIAIKSLALHF